MAPPIAAWSGSLKWFVGRAGDEDSSPSPTLALLSPRPMSVTAPRLPARIDAVEVSSYQVSSGPLDGLLTSRADLAACLLAQVRDTEFVRATLEITTSEDMPTLWPVIRREAFKRS